MKWKQFFTLTQSMDGKEAREFIKSKAQDSIEIIDVRQPKEYETGHIPGAKLIPMGDLDQRFSEIPNNKPTLVYCAIGGRSRMAVQYLAGKGFTNLINLSGGFKGWKGESAIGPLDQGMEFFTGEESIEYTLSVAYSIEDGLRDFYLSTAEKVSSKEAKALFKKLSEIEVKHQDRIYGIYENIVPEPVPRKKFITDQVGNAAEGGLTTDEYIKMYNPDLESVEEIIELAISIEAQALDLYSRASKKSALPEAKTHLQQLANEEHAHIKQLETLLGA